MSMERLVEIIFYKGPFNTNSLAAFLFYEMLTFGIPFLWAFLTLCLLKAPWHILHKPVPLKEHALILASLHFNDAFKSTVVCAAPTKKRISASSNKLCFGLSVFSRSICFFCTCPLASWLKILCSNGFST